MVSAFEAAEAKGGCAIVGDEARVDSALMAFAAAVVAALTPAGSAGTTTTTTTTGATDVSDTTTTTAASGTATTLPGGATTTTVPASATTTTLPAGGVSFSSDVQPIFTANCALSGCHAGPSPAQGLDLTAAQSYAHLVNVNSQQCPLFKRVLPGEPDGSYLVFKIAGPPQPCFSGNQMPGGGRPPLAAADRNSITAWIAEGAPGN